jgi:hypothetical protein
VLAIEGHPGSLSLCTGLEKHSPANFAEQKLQAVSQIRACRVPLAVHIVNAKRELVSVLL